MHIRFHLGTGIEVSQGDNAQAVILRLANGASWVFAATNGSLSVEESLIVDQDGRPHPTQQLVIAATTDKGGLTTGWQFKFLG
jgi:uncharacterized heparinase superfamily protein